MYRRFGTAVFWLSIAALLAAVINAGFQSRSFLAVCVATTALGNPDNVFVAVSLLWVLFGLVLFGLTQRISNPCLGQSLAAGLLGTTLIVIEATVGVVFPCEAWGGFQLEELLLASGGLNMLMEEARMADEYQGLLARRKDAGDQVDQIIEDIGTFRGTILTAAERVFGGERPKPSGASTSAPDPAKVALALRSIDKALGQGRRKGS